MKRITGLLHNEYLAQNMFRWFLILFTTIMALRGKSNLWNSRPYSLLSYNRDSKETSKIWTETSNPRRPDWSQNKGLDADGGRSILI